MCGVESVSVGGVFGCAFRGRVGSAFSLGGGAQLLPLFPTVSDALFGVSERSDFVFCLFPTGWARHASVLLGGSAGLG